MFTFSVVAVDLPTDYILSLLFPAETDVLVPVFSQSTDVVVVNVIVVLKFVNNVFGAVRTCFDHVLSKFSGCSWERILFLSYFEKIAHMSVV